MQNGAHPSVRDLRVSPEILVMDGQGLALPGFARRVLTYMRMRFISSSMMQELQRDYGTAVREAAFPIRSVAKQAAPRYTSTC